MCRDPFNTQWCTTPRYANMNDEWCTQCAAFQDDWPSACLPACKDLTSFREPSETESNLSHPSPFFFQFVTFAHISTRCQLTVSLEVLLSQWRSSFNQTSDALSRGRDPITHAHRARCPARVGPILNECFHCHCDP